VGSPETCPTCGSDDRAVRLMAGNVNDRYPCLHGWHKGTPTPPAPADDALPRVSEYEMNIPTHETPEEHLDRIRGHDAPDDAEARGCTVAFCETHRDVEILPGPFCPVCLGATCRADGARDGLTARRPAAHAGGAEAMRERAARAAAARCQEYADDFNRRGGSPDRISTAAFLRDEVAGAIRALPLPPATAVEVASDYAALFDWLDERVGDGRGSVHLGLTDNGGVGCWLPGDETVPEGESVEEAIRFRMERLAAEAAAKGGARG